MTFWVGFLSVLLAAALAFLTRYFRRWRQADRELKTTREELDVQRRAAQQEQKRKKDLVAFLAHDLKTPLTSVVGYLTLLRDKPGLYPAERARYTAVALEKAQRLEELLGEFFDISRMELHQDEGRRDAVQLTLLLEQITDEFYPLLGDKGLRLEADIAPGLVTVGDADKLARVFDNVLRNAVSYSHEGGAIRLSADLEEGRDSGKGAVQHLRPLLPSGRRPLHPHRRRGAGSGHRQGDRGRPRRLDCRGKQRGGHGVSYRASGPLTRNFGKLVEKPCGNVTGMLQCKISSNGLIFCETER